MKPSSWREEQLTRHFNASAVMRDSDAWSPRRCEETRRDLSRLGSARSSGRKGAARKCTPMLIPQGPKRLGEVSIERV